ncbi:MAG: WD40/YVTN/BNR-like repeat-containing protein, partial [Terriglobales bacterium]
MKTFVLTVLSLAGLGLTLAAQQLPALFAGMRWRSIGPYRSGNVYAVAGVPGDPTTYYLGLPEGGVWKTTDGGTVWKPIFDQEAVPAIGAVAVADSQPSTIYVATGDPTSWSFTPGEGMFKSTDSGAHWQRIGLDGTDYIPALLVDPHNPQLVLVGA